MRVTTPLTDEVLERLRAGDRASIDAIIYAGRDAAHERMVEALDRSGSLPFDPRGQIIYYMRPSPAKPGRPIGSAGPTTSERMDPYARRLMEVGLKGMIAKGNSSLPVREAMQRHGAVYFAAIGGTAALIAKTVTEAEVITYDDLGAEALWQLQVEEFPVVVVNDIYGGDAYQDGRKKYGSM